MSVWPHLRSWKYHQQYVRNWPNWCEDQNTVLMIKNSNDKTNEPKLESLEEFPVMRKFLGNVEWSKYRVVKSYPGVYMILRCGSPQAYRMTAQPAHSFLWESKFLHYGPTHKQKYWNAVVALWGLSDSRVCVWEGCHGCISIFQCVCAAQEWCLTVCRTDAGLAGSHQQTCSRSAI